MKQSRIMSTTHNRKEKQIQTQFFVNNTTFNAPSHESVPLPIAKVK